MTTIAAGLSIDSRGPCALYIASDSRITWNSPVKRWDGVQKSFASNTSPNIAYCYRCLRSFKNKFEHSHLDRHVGAELISYLLTGAQPQFHPARIKSSTELLANDLQRQNDGSLNLQTFVEVPTNSGGSIVAPILVEDNNGAKHVVALSGPLTTDNPADKGVAEYRLQGGAIKVLVENELLVRVHLPEATRRTQQKLRGEKL